MARDYPWPPGAATGVGSLPGTDIGEAVKTVFGDLADLPYLPELPHRGPGADMIGRTAGLLVEMPVELYAAQWRIAAHPGRDARRTADLWERDLDTLTDTASEYAGPVKLQVVGPWTLAASLDLAIGGRMLRDAGAVRDLTASLAEGLAAHVAAVRRRLPAATVILQLDEPALPGVLAGSVPTASGLYRVAAVEGSDAADSLRTVLDSASAPTVVHCCAPEIPFGCIKKAGATAASFDLGQFRLTDEEAFGEAVESGMGMFIGAVPSMPTAAGRRPDSDGRQPASAVIDSWLRIGLPAETLTEQVVVTPACGLAGATPSYARSALERCQAAAKLIPELIEEGVR